MPPDPIANFLDVMDTKNFAQEAAQNIPTLAHIAVSISYIDSSQAFWEVVRSTECSHVNEAHDLVVLNMRDWWEGMEMFWNVPLAEGS